MDIALLKWIHILSSTVLFGTGVGSAFYMFVANRSKQLPAILFAGKYVVIADWIFTTPAIIIQLATGVSLVILQGYDFSETWIIAALALYFFIGACWLPVVWLQIKMRDMAITADKNETELPDKYWRYEKWWTVLGAFAFPAIVLIFWLMVYKPN